MNDKVLYINSSSFSSKGLIPTTEDAIGSIMIEGYASTSEVDRAQDVIPTSAWERGMDKYLTNPIMLAFHNHNEPVGKMVDYRIDEKGLWISARISAASEKVFNLVKDNIITAFSVGFRIVDAEYKPDADLFIIKELELHEISLVSVGMNAGALFSLSKAFDSAADYTIFKEQFTTEAAPAKELGKPATVKSVDNPIIKDEEIDMNTEELSKLISEATAKAAKEAATEAVTATLAAQKVAADEAAKTAAEAATQEEEFNARVAAAVKAATATPVVDTSAPSGTEKLMAEIEKRIAAAAESQKDVLDGLNAELKAKTDEIEAMNKSKMVFVDKGGEAVSYQEKENAFLLGHITRKGLTGTKYGQNLVEKVGAHVASATWELEVSTRMESEIRQKLVIASLFRSIPMQTNVMTIPVNPEAGLATWVTNAQFGTTASTGAAQTHQLGEITLNAYKVATLEYLTNEEEEDALLVLLPMIRDAMIRRLARAIDRAYLRGAGAGTDPVKGVALYDAASAITHSASSAVTVAKMNALRQDLGIWGLDAMDLRFVVSTSVYHDLLLDTTFQTADKVGVDRATLLTGQIGSIGNTPVLVSGEFDARTSGNDGALCIAPANFMAGNQRGLRFETGDLIETQRKAMVASLRTGLIQTTSAQGEGVSTLEWS